MAKRIERVLTNDPGIGVARHVDAGYEEAERFAEKTGVKVPMKIFTSRAIARNPLTTKDTKEHEGQRH